MALRKRSALCRGAALIGAALGVVAFLTAPVDAKPPKPAPDAPGQGGLEGADDARVESINVPARIFRVAVVPGTTNDVWAMGHAVSYDPSLNKSDSGQLVFLRNQNNAGWVVVGPPVGTGYKDVILNAFALAKTANGVEGWAVGQNGTVVRMAPGTDQWVISTLCPQVTCASIEAITLSGDGSRGYAVGGDGTVLRLHNTSWVLDAQLAGQTSSVGGVNPEPVTGPSGRPALNAVAMSANGNEVWAISSQSSDPNGRGIELFRRNASGTWDLKRTGVEALDNPTPTFTNDRVRIAVHGAAAAAAGNDNIWFAGSFFPFDPANPNGDPSTGGTSQRPFALRYKVDTGSFVAYCTPAATAAGAASASAPSLCGAGSGTLPPSAYPITTLSALASGEVFAGGLGLYHFRPPTSSTSLGRWFREPDPVGYLSSISFANGGEGWMAATGGVESLSLTGSTSLAIGHYTREPAPSVQHVARWAYPSKAVPYGVATSPDGKAPPIAVGEDGRILMKTDLGWDETGIAKEASSNNRHTHLAVAYAGTSGVAWAVGDSGHIVAIENGAPSPEYAVATRPGNKRDILYGVAFSGADRGYAVGSAGAIVRFDRGAKSMAECAAKGTCWTADPKSGVIDVKLWAVSTIGNGPGFIAVGDNGTVLVNSDGAAGNWVPVTSIKTSLLRTPSGGAPNLFAVDSLPDGTIVVGGARSALIVRDPRDPVTTFKLADRPQEGTILALQARREGSLKLIASLAPNGTEKFAGAQGGTTRGWLVQFDGTRWLDLQPSSNRSKLLDGLDDAMSRDPVYSIAVEPSGRGGWAVGGRWGSSGFGAPGQGGHDGSSYEAATQSLYRFDLTGDARSTAESVTPVKVTDVPAGGYSFAFFSDTACGAQLCSVTAGTGTAADEVALRIRDDINAAYRADPVNGPQFVLFGGSSRGLGSPDELGQFAAYLAGFDIPVFGVPGSRDRTPPPATQGLMPGVPFNLAPDQSPDTAGDTSAYQRMFASMPAPWGTAGKEQGRVGNVTWSIEPVASGVSDATCTGSCASTYYAFDYHRNGKRVGRFVMLDTSSGGLAASENAFITNVLPPTLRGETPSFLVMNIPTRNPGSFSNDPALSPNDISTIENTAFGAGATAAFAGGFHVNATYTAPQGVSGAVPYFVAGSGGSPLDGTGMPDDAHYHAWLLATVNPNVSAAKPQAAMTLRSVPVVESVSFIKDFSLVGANVINIRGGTAIKLTARARAIDGGGRAGDTKAMNRMYVKLPVGPRCESAGDNGFIPTGCFNKRGIVPDYKFISESPEIADFVYSGGSGTPVRSNGRLTKDPTSGLLCTFRTGQVWVRIESGGRMSRMLLNVVPGIGPCVVDAVSETTELPQIAAEPDEPRAVRPAPNNPPAPPAAKPAKAPAPPPPTPKPVVPGPPQPEPVPVAKPAPKVFLAPSPLAEIVPALMPPAPSLLPSPAPPASATAAGAQKQEDKEVQHESASEDGGDFVAIQHRRDYGFDPVMGWMLMGVAALLGVFGAGVAATKKGGAGRPAHAPVTYPRNLR